MLPHLLNSKAHSWAPLESAVLALQVTFLALGYLDAAYFGELRESNCHISGVLDHERRAVRCAVVALLSMAALVALELSRPVALRKTRVALAATTGTGIFFVCAVRESTDYLVHSVAACVAFGTALALVWVVVLCLPDRAARRACARRACALSATCGATGTAQAMYLLRVWTFPSPSLAFGEWAVVVGFGFVISQMSHPTLGEEACPPPTLATVRATLRDALDDFGLAPRAASTA